MTYPFQRNYINFIKSLKKIWWKLEAHYENIKAKKQYNKLLQNDSLIISQRENIKSIPVLIINFNQLFYLEQLINFLIERKFENIIILDNKSTYPPLLDYYKKIEDKIKIEYLVQNYGHQVLFKVPHLLEKYGKGYYFLTDSDIVPNNNLPDNFADEMMKKLDQYFSKVTKIGFALRIDNIPDHFKLKEKVLTWEKLFWQNQVEPNGYLTTIDTTFALYKPQYGLQFTNIDFLKGLRIAGDYSATHGGWYLNTEHLSEENKFYFATVNKSASWALDKEGKSFAGYEKKENRNF
ncbi:MULTISPECIES: hypothetical protein [unclassified Kaistella]|uniref:hypothetical protein n=1 Tax=unclassified Kaistella TaxID=2762626 RepID=UPI0027361B2A|nr:MULTISPECIES: hypothetical protein [unclassified Kaistella]MDP2454931.1 hypothetical protein [Kaistella sp. SH11-4b]MDP2456086.1 hypothetical protein [Kaistella sp. SH40-3]MDP2460601.1 hypothetical protein [Kaistella sp. SH19-2b]